MLASRTLLILLVFVYFIVPVPVSEFIFENEFYIYSNLQTIANRLSLVYGGLFTVWVYLLFKPTRTYLSNGAATRLVNWPGMRVAYFGMIVYSVLLILYGQQLRTSGASREDLLGGMDEFLLPGMSLLLLGSSIFAVSKANRWQFYSLFFIFLLIDVTYNGKIFSFIALILFFVRIDCADSTTRTIIKAFAFWAVFGVSMLLLSGLTRISLAGDDLTINAIGIAYLFGSEFLGVQASIGWGVDYFAKGYPQTFWTFGATLEQFYKSSVGHGLATSPGAFFEANFGSGGPFMAILACGISLMVFRLSARSLGWVAYLVVAINFQHFLRHGIDVFMSKVISQMIFAIIIAKLASPPRRAAVVPPAHVSEGIR